MNLRRLLGSATVATALLASSCGSSESTDTSDAADTTAATTDTAADAASASDASEVSAAGIRLVSPTEGAEIQADPPDDLVILDVRTQEEFDAGHLEGAIVIDFYGDSFTDELAALDPNVPYLLYCQSGNRSGQTTDIMSDLGFTDVADVDGGISSWTGAGLPTVTN